jgi:23S rRNA (uracil1939-C5)-methyltransferase
MFPHTSHVESIGVFDLVEDFVPREFEEGRVDGSAVHA